MTTNEAQPVKPGSIAMPAYDNQRQPCVHLAGKVYSDFDALLSAHPELADEHALFRYCTLLLHFHPGPGCVLIADPDAYRTRYEVRYAASARIPPDDLPIPPPPVGFREPAGPPEPYSGDLPPLAETQWPFMRIEADPTVLADFGRYDVSEVALPAVRDGKVVFYVEETTFGIPYRVEAPWGGAVDGNVQYDLLEHLSA